MNPDTLVVVHCYSGDAEQVKNALPIYLSHECPVLILSPEDAPVIIDHPGVECRQAGKRGYFGQDSLDRQRAHLEILLEYPQTYFLLNDSDSVCLSPEIPAYLYARANGTVWSNEVREGRPHESEYPKIAFHPPYFMTRNTIKRMLAVADIPAHEITPFIDWYMLAMACEAGLRHESYPDGRSFPAWRHGPIPETKELGHNYVHEPAQNGGKDGAARMRAQVERGIVMVHSVKHRDVLQQLVKAHDYYVRTGRDPLAPPSTGGVSLLVPFREDSSGTRTRVWEWVESFYRENFPDAEIVVGNDEGSPYSKSVAINDAASRATGYVFVILDSDVVIDPDRLREAAVTINQASKPVWFLPYQRAYRLTQERSDALRAVNPREEAVPLDVPADSETEDQIDGAPGFAQVMSRRAFFKVGGMDPRFRGWGGEDTSFVRAMDTLYGPHSRMDGHLLHLWHDRPGAGSAATRRWDGQEGRERDLWNAYKRATSDPAAMRALVDEGLGGRG
jgi:hypothetical protein